MTARRGIDLAFAAGAILLAVLSAAGVAGGVWRWLLVALTVVLAALVVGRSGSPAAADSGERDGGPERLGEVRLLRDETIDYTGIVGVRVFDDAITHEVRRSRRTGRPVSLIVTEIDDFGGLDGRHGAGAADEATHQVGSLIRSSAREIDIVAQLAAGQFGILLPETESGGAALVAERLRTAIARWSPQSGVPLTASFGVAGWVEGEDVLADADGALAEAHERGRDCVVVAGDDDLAS